tara:strand:+ start:166 stop:1260 length:1095 start_codon:yes stop_codon:yes gene_type:complete
MALTYSSFSSFDEVVNHYENVKPMGGISNKGKDVRPMGDRKRKYERIVKISDNCYAFSDGFHFGDALFSYGWGFAVPAEFVPTLKDMEKYAPIVWRKKRDGTEQVTIRNGYGESAHNSRYAFINRHTPRGLGFTIASGKQYISRTLGRYRDDRTDPRHYLAKTRTAPRDIYEDLKKNSKNNWWTEKCSKWTMLHDDNSALVFNKTTGKDQFSGVDWVHVEGTGRTIPKGPRVDKQTKAKFKDAINSFFEWGMTMSPLLALEDDEYISKQIAILTESYGGTHGGYGGSWLQPDAKIGREIVRDDQHTARLAFWVHFASNCYEAGEGSWSFKSTPLLKRLETKEDVSTVRSRFNTFINTELGFVKK